MSEVAARELRNDTSGPTRRVNAGERVVITVDGRPAAELCPVRGGERQQWSPRAEVARRLRTGSADAGLQGDPDRLADGATDELDAP